MGTIASAFSAAFPDGTPVSKRQVRAIGPVIESAFAASLGDVSVAYATKAELDADLDHAADSTALVYADATDANNDLYVKVGASGAGSWANTGALHSIMETLNQAYRENIHVTSADGVAIDVFTRELRPGSDRHARWRIALQSATLLEIYRVTGAWLCERTGPGAFTDENHLIDASTIPIEILARETGQADSMGSIARHVRSATAYYVDGRSVSAGDMVGISMSARSFEVAQRGILYQPVTDTPIAAFHSRHIFDADGFRLEFRYEMVESFSLASLIVGKTPVVLEDGATEVFDELRGENAWHTAIDLTAAVSAVESDATAYRYSSSNLGLGLEVAIERGSDWLTDESTATVNTDGSTQFDWHDAEYSSALAGGTMIRGGVSWRFGYSGVI